MLGRLCAASCNVAQRPFTQCDLQLWCQIGMLLEDIVVAERFACRAARAALLDNVLHVAAGVRLMLAFRRLPRLISARLCQYCNREGAARDDADRLLTRAVLRTNGQSRAVLTRRC